MKTFTIVFFLAISLLSFNCKKFSFGGMGPAVVGSGNVVRETRNVPVFTGIEIDGFCDVELSQSSHPSVVVETDSNLLEHITTEIKGGVLTLGTKPMGSIQTQKGIKLYVSTAQINQVKINGSGTIKGITPIKADDLSIEVSGSGEISLQVQASTLSSDISGNGRITLEGNATKHKVDISGSGDLEASKLLTNETDITTAGSGDAKVHVARKLKADISGSGNVDYTGDASDINVSASGSGRIRKQ